MFSRVPRPLPAGPRENSLKMYTEEKKLGK